MLSNYLILLLCIIIIYVASTIEILISDYYKPASDNLLGNDINITKSFMSKRDLEIVKVDNFQSFTNKNKSNSTITDIKENSIIFKRVEEIVGEIMENNSNKNQTPTTELPKNVTAEVDDFVTETIALTTPSNENNQKPKREYTTKRCHFSKIACSF